MAHVVNRSLSHLTRTHKRITGNSYHALNVQISINDFEGTDDCSERPLQSEEITYMKSHRIGAELFLPVNRGTPC